MKWFLWLLRREWRNAALFTFAILILPVAAAYLAQAVV